MAILDCEIFGKPNGRCRIVRNTSNLEVPQLSADPNSSQGFVASDTATVRQLTSRYQHSKNPSDRSSQLCYDKFDWQPKFAELHQEQSRLSSEVRELTTGVRKNKYDLDQLSHGRVPKLERLIEKCTDYMANKAPQGLGIGSPSKRLTGLQNCETSANMTQFRKLRRTTIEMI